MHRIPRAEEADGEPANGEEENFAQDHPNNLRLLSAKRHSHADLVRSLGYGIGDRAVQSDAGNDQREERKGGAKTGECALLDD